MTQVNACISQRDVKASSRPLEYSMRDLLCAQLSLVLQLERVENIFPLATLYKVATLYKCFGLFALV